MKMENKGQVVVYKNKVEVHLENETVWLPQKQMAELFSTDRSVITKHINNIFKTNELSEKSNVQKMHITNSDKPVKLYSLDVILAVGYRTNSSKAIAFRIWATKTLKQHLLQGYTINKKRIGSNYQKFMQAVEDVKELLPAGNAVSAQDALELINVFASTWFSLSAYDAEKFPKKGATKKQVYFTCEELIVALQDLKKISIAKKQATEFFGQETNKNAVCGIVGNVFQSFDQNDVYPSIE